MENVECIMHNERAGRVLDRKTERHFFRCRGSSLKLDAWDKNYCFCLVGLIGLIGLIGEAWDVVAWWFFAWVVGI